MDPNQYYENLMQQGYNSADATNLTQQYYPNFDGPAQGMAMMTPPPVSMEMGGMAAGGLGAPTGGMVAGGITAGGAVAGGAAAAGGGMSVATIAVVSVLVLGGAGAGGYFLYEYLTEPDFYGEVYWTEMGVAYIFEEDGWSIGFPLIDGSCDMYENEDEIYWDLAELDMKKSDGICKSEMDYDSYSSENKGDYYEICVDGEDCIKVYPFERGMIMQLDGECMTYVSDINPPPIADYSSEDSYFGLERGEWMDEWADITEEILDEDDAPSCNGSTPVSTGGGLDTFQFTDRDAAGQMTDEGGDALVHVKMTQGSDLSWALLKVSIVVEDGYSFACEEAGNDGGNADCTYTIDDDNYWSVAEEITIYEGDNLDLCDGSNGGCTVDITLTKLGVGGEDSKVLFETSAYADANQNLPVHSYSALAA